MTSTKASDRRETHRAVERYIRGGLAPIPLPTGSKNPNRPGWQNERWTAEDVPRQWNNGQGVGILWGEPSGGVVDVDLDWPEAVAVAHHLLPETRAFGRPSAPGSHRVYRTTGTTPKTQRFKVPGEGSDNSIVELLSTGAQSLVPPSLHESGEARCWYEERPAQEIDGEELAERVREVATAALLVRHWPGKGARHDYVLSATGYIGRNLPRGRTERVMEAAIRASGDEEAHGRLRDVRDTLDKLERGEYATGGPTLDQLVPSVVDHLRRWHGWGAERTRARRTTPGSFPLTDLGNAERLIHLHGSDLRYCHPWRKWLVWDGQRWVPDDTAEVERRAVETVRTLYGEAEAATDDTERKQIARWAMASEARARIEAMTALARSLTGVPVSPQELDADPWVLNVGNGTIDLRTGELRGHRRADLLTKLAPVPYDPEAQALRFEEFMHQVLVKEALIEFVRRFAGYSLTGSTEERVFAILWGLGKNGKSTLVELLRDVLGDYAKNTDTETILRRKYTGVGNDVAALRGARFVSAAEVEQGRALAESKVKNLTGSDTVTARFLFAEPFDFRPQFKLWLSTNHKPIIRGTDDAIWDRIRLIPFTRRFEGKDADRQLPQKLRGELAGVLAWMVRGCLEWQRDGLGEPDEVANATAEYRSEMDTLAAFIEDRCVADDEASVPATPLYHAYREWCDENGEACEKQRAFGMALRDRGFEGFKYGSGPHKDRSGWRGIGLRAEDDPPSGGGDGAGSRQNTPDDPPPSGGIADDPPLSKSRKDKGNSPDSKTRAEESGGTFQNLRPANSYRGEAFETSSASSASSAGAKCKHGFTPSFCNLGCGQA